MADSFYVINSFRTVQVMSPTVVLDVQYATCATIPNQLGFAYAVPLDAWKAGDAGGLLDVIAGQLEGIYSGGQISASSPIQDIDQNGLLSDTIDVVVKYDRTAAGLPALFGTVNIPVQAFFSQETGIGGFHVPGSESPQQYVTDEYQRLAALAGA